MVTTRRKAASPTFRAIADPTRREILSLLRAGPQSVGELASNFRTSRPAISKHLRLLRSAGLVATRKAGAAHMCHLNARPLRAISAWLQDYEVFWSENLRGLKHYVEETGDQPKEKDR